MECRAYGICLDSQSRGYLGKDRKVSSAAGGNLSRMHKTEETAKESRLNIMYSHLRNRTLVGHTRPSLVVDVKELVRHDCGNAVCWLLDQVLLKYFAPRLFPGEEAWRDLRDTTWDTYIVACGTRA